MEKVIKAFKFGMEKHQGQTRKVSGDSYFTHPLAVSYILARYKTSKNMADLIAACYLHDVLEDTDCTYEEMAELFGPLVASLAIELTNNPDEIKQQGKLEYHKKKFLSLSSYALTIKLADRMHNLLDNPTPKMLKESSELMQHILFHRDLNKTQRTMVIDIIDIIKTKQKESK